MLAVSMATLVATASLGSLEMLDSQCSTTGDCSAKLQALASQCSDDCTIRLTPPFAAFRMEQHAAISVVGVRGFALQGDGARLSFDDGSAPFISVLDSYDVVLTNFTLDADRPPYTYGIVVAEDELPPHTSTNTATPVAMGGNSSAAPGTAMAMSRVRMKVDLSKYTFTEANAAWTANVDALYEIDPVDKIPVST